MSSKHGKRYTPRFKFQLVMETIKSSKTIDQIANIEFEDNAEKILEMYKKLLNEK